jgi:hypothetical protein
MWVMIGFLIADHHGEASDWKAWQLDGTSMGCTGTAVSLISLPHLASHRRVKD